MTGFIVTDGTGSNGANAKVNANNRLYTSSLSTTSPEAAADRGESYHVITGLITLTSANESGVFYLKNNNSIPFRVKSVIGGFGLSTGGAAGDTAVVELLRNPTAGTVVDDATAASIRCNRNFGSSALIQDNALVYKGAEAKTFTDGVSHFLIHAPTANNFEILVDEVLPLGKSIGVNVTPPASNSSLSSYVGLIGHFEDVNE